MQTDEGTESKSLSPILVYCEGAEDSAFLRYLKNRFHHDHEDTFVRVMTGNGGTMEDLVIAASKIEGDYSHRIIILDKDRCNRPGGQKELKTAQELADLRGITFGWQKPCLEWLLLKILDPSLKEPRAKFCGTYKQSFESTYFKDKDRTESDDYKSIFPKSLLNERRQDVPELDYLMKLVRGQIL